MATTAPASAGIPEVPSGLEAEAQLLEALCEVPTITRVVASQQATGADTLLTMHMSQRNLPANSWRKYAVHTVLSADGAVGPFSMPLELPDALLVSSSPKGNLQLVIKAGTDSISVIHQLWNASRLVAELQVPKSLHGALMNDGYFASGVAWSPDGGAVAYTAEVPVAERTPAWGGPESLKDAAGTKSWRGQGPAVEDWGELYTGKRAPAVFILDLRMKCVIKAGGLAADMTCGQPVWTRDSTGLLVVGWPSKSSNFPNMHRRLGAVYCYNRPCQVYHVAVARDAQGTLGCGASATSLTPTLGSSYSPAFSPNGQHLVFLSSDAAVNSGTHNATAALYKLPWPQAMDGATAPQVVVDVVQDPATEPQSAATTRRPFPGLYPVGLLLTDAFIDNSTLLLNSVWYCQAAVLAVHLDSGHVTPITPVDTPLASWSLMATTKGRAFAVQVAPDTPARLMAATLPHGAESETHHLEWTTIGPYQELPSLASGVVSGLEYLVHRVTPTTGPKHVFDSIVFSPRNRTGPLPTVLVPHGGPHAVVTVGWYMPFAFLAHLGYTVILPNFRGSVGYGEAALQSLPGHVGVHDVGDCVDAVRAAADAGLTDPSRVAVVGGSHGGFLAGHLAGQFPDSFKCIVMRNPVLNVSLMNGVSDIPDWCYISVLGSKEGRQRARDAATPEDLAAFYQASPIAHAHKVKAPTLFLIGAKDRRVPLVDSLQYNSALKAAGVTTRVITFPEDTHALDKVQTEFEQWMNTAMWLKDYC